MIFTTKHDADTTVVRPGTQRLTAQNAKTFKDEIVELVNSGTTMLIVDFTEVSFLDSSGLGALVGVLKRIGHRGELVLCGLSKDVEQMFRICRMDRVFNIYPDVKTAIQTLSERS